MQILVDMGNTRTKFCSFESDIFGDTESISNAELSNEWMNHHWHQASKLAVASVAEDKVTKIVKAWCRSNDIELVNVETENHHFDVVNGYQNHRQLGVDRWLALLGARRIFPAQTCIIIDAGTATTVDVLDAKGKHHGGWILAGIDTLIDSIQLKTAKVTGEKLSLEGLNFGKNTSENLDQAAWAATLGLINQAKALVEAQGIGVSQVIVTGGNAEKLLSLSGRAYEYEPQLIFHGLATYL